MLLVVMLRDTQVVANLHVALGENNLQCFDEYIRKHLTKVILLQVLSLIIVAICFFI